MFLISIPSSEIFKTFTNIVLRVKMYINKLTTSIGKDQNIMRIIEVIDVMQRYTIEYFFRKKVISCDINNTIPCRLENINKLRKGPNRKNQ